MDTAKIAARLECYIGYLDALAAGYGAAGSLQESYAKAQAHDALLGHYGQEIFAGYQAYLAAQAAQQYGEQKIQHLYL